MTETQESIKKPKRKNRIKPTDMQILAANKLSEGIGSIGEAMRAGGYTESSSKTPQILTESRGFQVYCEEIGLTRENIANMLMEDLKAKPQKRVGELAIAAKATGLTKETKENENKEGINITFILNSFKVEK